MAGMSVDGLVSGLDTTSLIAKLVQAEGSAQASLKTRLTIAQAAASAYRSVNTRMDALRTAAEAMMKPETWDTVAIKISNPTVSATKILGTKTGSITFDVNALAATHTVQSTVSYASTAAVSDVSTLEVTDAAGTSVLGTITIKNNATVAETIAAINASSYGLKARAVDVGGRTRIEVAAGSSGAAGAFGLRPRNPNQGATGFAMAVQGADASVTMGTGAGATTFTSSTNEFSQLWPGLTVKVSAVVKAVTVDLAVDTAPLTDKVQALVDAANAALSGIKNHSDQKGGPASILKGDGALRRLAAQILSDVSSAIGTDGSAGAAGMQLSKDGTVVFDKAKFVKALEADPDKVRRALAGAPTAGADGSIGTADDGVPGVAQRMLEHARFASDAATGQLTRLAEGRDKLAKDIQVRIEAWDLRLAARRDMLTRQFAAMETALSGLRNQSTWLSGQINALPS